MNFPNVSPHKPLKFHLIHKELPASSPRKRNYKFIHGFNINKNSQPKTILPKFKYLTSLNHRSGYTLTNLPLWKKLIKPYRKYLRKVKGNFECPQIQKLLPLLSDLELTFRSHNYHLLSSRSAFRKLFFNFGYSLGSRIKYDEYQEELQKFLHKHKAMLSRSLPIFRELSHLTIKLFNNDIKSVILMLRTISDLLSSHSLKHFNLIIDTCKSLQGEIPPSNGAFRLVTNLDVDEGTIISPFIASGDFKNLIHLRILYFVNRSPWDPNHLAHFQDFPKLKKLIFSCLVNLYANEREFFENFALPASLENLDLNITSFTWNENRYDEDAIQKGFENDPLYLQFYGRLKNCPGLKVLNLTCQDDAGRFTRHFVEQFNQLEELLFNYGQSSSRSRIEPLVFKNFWEAVSCSKETLTSVIIDYPHIAFPEKIDALEAGFPKLRKLRLPAYLTPPNELGAFSKKLPSLEEICLGMTAYDDVKKLEYFLSFWKLIPQKMNATVNLDVTGIKKKLLVACLTKYVSEVKVRGELEMKFTIGKYQPPKAFEGLVELRKEKESLEKPDVSVRKDSIVIRGRRDSD